MNTRLLTLTFGMAAGLLAASPALAGVACDDAYGTDCDDLYTALVKGDVGLPQVLGEYELYQASRPPVPCPSCEDPFFSTIKEARVIELEDASTVVFVVSTPATPETITAYDVSDGNVEVGSEYILGDVQSVMGLGASSIPWKGAIRMGLGASSKVGDHSEGMGLGALSRELYLVVDKATATGVYAKATALPEKEWVTAQ